MGKRMIYIAKDVDPLFNLEENKSKLVSELLRNHYTFKAVKDVPENDKVSEIETSQENTENVSEPNSVTKRDESIISPLEVDGRIEDEHRPTVDGNLAPGGDPSDGAVWN